jgi:predicted N-formylglutamate amidohydrolase
MLLAPDEPPAVTVLNENGRSPFLIACDHAGRRIPRRLGTLGLSPAELDRHIAWDIGVDPLSRIVSEALDATLVQQPYSRLVIDCNRPTDVASSVPERSEDTAIPGNLRLTDAERRARIVEIFNPYHQRLAAELDRRSQARQRTVLLALHTFTPRYRLEVRPWQIGLLYHRDRRSPGLWLVSFAVKAGSSLATTSLTT